MFKSKSILIAILSLLVFAGCSTKSNNNPITNEGTSEPVLTSVDEYGYSESCIYVRDNMQRVPTYLNGTQTLDAILFGGDLFIPLEELNDVIVPSYEDVDEYIAFSDISLIDSEEDDSISYTITVKEYNTYDVDLPTDHPTFSTFDDLGCEPRVKEYTITIQPNSDRVFCYEDEDINELIPLEQLSEYGIHDWVLLDKNSNRLYIDIDIIRRSYHETPTLPIKAIYQDEALYLDSKEPMEEPGDNLTEDKTYITEQAKDLTYSTVVLGYTFSVCSSYTQEDYDYQRLKLQSLIDTTDTSEESLAIYEDFGIGENDVVTEWYSLLIDGVDKPEELKNLNYNLVNVETLSDKEQQLYNEWKKSLLIKAINNRKSVAENLLTKSETIGFRDTLEDFCVDELLVLYTKVWLMNSDLVPTTTTDLGNGQTATSWNIPDLSDTDELNKMLKLIYVNRASFELYESVLRDGEVLDNVIVPQGSTDYIEPFKESIKDWKNRRGSYWFHSEDE